jgi:hypothetical protein
MKHEMAIRNASKKRVGLAEAFFHLKAAFSSNRKSGICSNTVQAMKVAKKVEWHVRHIDKYGFTDLDNINMDRFSSVMVATKYSLAERVKIFERCEKSLRKLLRYLHPESESTKSTEALLAIVVAGRKEVSA